MYPGGVSVHRDITLGLRTVKHWPPILELSCSLRDFEGVFAHHSLLRKITPTFCYCQPSPDGFLPSRRPPVAIKTSQNKLAETFGRHRQSGIVIV